MTKKHSNYAAQRKAAVSRDTLTEVYGDTVPFAGGALGRVAKLLKGKPDPVRISKRDRTTHLDEGPDPDADLPKRSYKSGATQGSMRPKTRKSGATQGSMRPKTQKSGATQGSMKPKTRKSGATQGSMKPKTRKSGATQGSMRPKTHKKKKKKS